MEKNIQNQPLISIITVCFNSAVTIRRTIESVLNQTYTNIEYILVDGKSTDTTVAIIEEYAPLFAERGIPYKWISESDKGIYDAMNKGGKLSHGKYINFMNSGDLFYDQSVIDEINVFLDADLTYGNHAVYQEDLTKIKVYNVANYTGSRNIPYCHQSLFISRKYFELFPFDTTLKIAADYKQYLQCKFAGANIKYIPFVIALYLDGGVSSISRKQLVEDYYKVMKKYYPFYAFMTVLIRKFKILFFNKN